MPHKCLHCGLVYPDNDNTVLKGCTCGSVFFLYIRTPKDEQKFEEIEKELETKETTLVAEVEKQLTQTKPKEKVKEIDTIATVKIPTEGVYEINLDALMKKQPLIILKKEKTYLIHLASIFEQVKERT